MDGTRIAVAATEDLFHDMVIFVLDGILGTEIYEPLRGHKGYDGSVLSSGSSRSVAFNPDALRIISGYDDGIRLWDTISGTAICAIKDRHEDLVDRWLFDCRVTSVAFSPDGRQIVSGYSDGSICTRDAISGATVLTPWDAASWVTSLGPMCARDGVVSVPYSPDGTQIVSCSKHGEVFVWDVSRGVNSRPTRGFCYSGGTRALDQTKPQTNSNCGFLPRWH